ncbi:hypothetical protein HMI54_009088 [Coelomomyces lativittatus]|nr:hypothetical protein HMI54_009088 [Coelomomyces lativittatus]KAJ1507893.1 hypothetical protein HMI55_000598 [Coelomomyces lativittatus]
MFKLHGYVDLWFASDNADALFHYREIRQHKDYFDIIFLDNEYFTLTHRDVCSQIRKEDRIQVIFSFCPSNAQPENSKALGYDDCMNKPLTQEDLKDTLSLWLKISQQRRLKYFQYKLSQLMTAPKVMGTKEMNSTGPAK